MGEKNFLKFLGADQTRRLRFRIITRKGKVIDFLVQLEVFTKIKWHPVVRYDFSHGFPHRDILLPDGQEEKTPLSLETLEQCVQYAEQDLVDRDEWYVEQFMKKMR
ncbi:MAG: hypothetical protein HYT97_02850 [Elusimicrobia bacterium]|nr:hypothetical protein [Elusimicrobiota bacterium]